MLEFFIFLIIVTYLIGRWIYEEIQNRKYEKFNEENRKKGMPKF